MNKKMKRLLLNSLGIIGIGLGILTFLLIMYKIIQG